MSDVRRKRKGLEFRTGKPPRLIVFSLKDFDINQGQDFKEWEKESILSNLMNRLRELSSFTVIQATQNGVLTIYGEFPENSDFRHPRHIAPNVKWCVIKIQGKERIAGYIDDNIIYVVFLDKEHKFWITEKKHT